MNRSIAFLAVAATLAANASEAQIIPYGEFQAIDGRPGNGLTWRGDAVTAKRMIDAFRARANPLVIDYEHQTFRAAENGQPAPAAGWIDDLIWKEGVGLFAAVRWTERAAQMIKAGEYKYLSPGLEFDKRTGDIVALHPCGLVNHPAIDGMQELFSAVARYSPTEETSMKELLKAVLAALSLKEDCKESDAVTAFAALKAKADGADTATTEIATLKTKLDAASKASPDPAKFVELAAFEGVKTELATLKAAQSGRDIDELVKAGLADGRILPQQEAWARGLGAKDIAQLKSYVESAVPVAALSRSQTGGKGPVGGGEKDPTEIATLATQYQAEQLKAGNPISIVEAVDHVSAAKK